MRLHEVERGDSPISQILIRILSLVSEMRLPDVARVALYHKPFSGDSMSSWTHAAMRGESAWSVGTGTDGSHDRQVECVPLLSWGSWRYRGASVGKAAGALHP